jgi:hypothetical protein
MGCGASSVAISPNSGGKSDNDGPAAVAIEPFFSTSKASDKSDIIVPMLSSTLFDMYMSKGDLRTFAEYFVVAKFPATTKLFVQVYLRLRSQ